MSPKTRLTEEELKQKAMMMLDRYSTRAKAKELEIYQEHELTEKEITQRQVELEIQAEMENEQLMELQQSPSKRRIKSPIDEEEMRMSKAQVRQQRISRLSNARSLRAPQDDLDWSRDPSYTNFQMPYELICRYRYAAKKKLYEEQFQYEIAQIMQNHGSAYEETRFVRHFSFTTLWPPLHNRSEIERIERNFFSLTPKERKRLNWIMSTNII